MHESNRRPAARPRRASRTPVLPAGVLAIHLILTLAALAAVLVPSRAHAAPPGFDAGGLLGTDDQTVELDIPVTTVWSQSALVPGQTAHLAVLYSIPPKAHIQINEFLFVEAAEGQPFSFGIPVLPSVGKVEFLEEDVYVGRLALVVPVTVAKDLAPGRHQFKIQAGFQACAEEPAFLCYAPKTVDMTVPVEVVADAAAVTKNDSDAFASLRSGRGPGAAGASDGAGGAAGGTGAGDAGAADAEASKDLASRVEAALRTGSILAFFLVFLGGIGTSFTPCVYPMIPITISYIGGSSKTKLGGFIMSIFFVLGIALTYAVLGMVAASTGALFGSAMQSTPVLLVVAVIFFAMGASMLGAFDLAVPSGLQSRLQAGPRTGIVGALFMGMVTGIVASPCVGPVLVVLLTFVAEVGNLAYGFLLLFVFALGLGMLFLVIGTFAGALNALPQAGQWMDTVKHVFGVILFAMGIYYVRTLIGPNLTMIASGLLVLMVGTFLGAFHAMPEHPSKKALLSKGIGLALFLAGGFVLLVGTAGVAGIQLPGGGQFAANAPGSGGSTPAAGVTHPGLDWIGDDAEGLARARAEGKPVVIDFYADWCAACKELDHKTWVDADVRAEADRFVAIKMDFTEVTAWSKEKMKQYRVPGLPTVIFLDSDGEEVERFFGFRGPDQVLASMREVE